MTLDDCISEVRQLLDQPMVQKPSPHLIHLHLKYNAQLIFNNANNASPNWQVRTWDLVVGSGSDTYIIAANDFGKDVLVHTLNPSNPQYAERQIRRCDIQSLPHMYDGPKQYGTVDTPNTPTAELMCFFWRDTVPYVLVRPQPNGTAMYRIWYETRVVDTELSSQPILPAGHPYLNLLTAVACLPHAEWMGLAPEANTAKRQELAVTLDAATSAHSDAFRKYMATDKVDGVVRKRPFPDYDYDYYKGGRGAAGTRG
jgi:hypothetical protein